MWRSTLTAAYLSSAMFTSPCLAASAAPSKPISLKAFINRLKTRGTDSQLPAVLARLTGLPPDAKTKGLEAELPDASDGVARTADVVFDPAKADRPIGLYWTTTREIERRSEQYQYHTALDGTLKKAVRLDGQLDVSGKVVRGATKPTDLDVRSTEVNERFRHEVLDFWLKGTGRKTGKAPKN